MRLLNYIEDYTPLLMVEKVNKSEIKQILKSTEVYVGAEYEFIVTDLGEPSESMLNMYEYAYDAFQKYAYAYDVWVQENNDLLAEKEKLEVDITEIKDEIDRLKYLNYDEDDEYRSNTKKELARMEARLKVLENQDEPDEPEPDNKYFDYMDEIGQQYSSYGSYYSFKQPYEPSEVNQLDTEGAIENWLDNVASTKPPFGKNYGISGTVNMGHTQWIVKEDSSLNEGGIEIISPPMPMKDFIKICPEMFDWIEEVGHTDSSCGFHIHMSLKSQPDLQKVLDMSKLVMFTDEGYIWKFFEGREDNQYVSSVKDKLKGGGGVVMDKTEIDFDVNSSHYNSINWEGLDSSHGHIEFRHVGGSNYTRKWDKVKTITAQFAYNLNLACDPKFKWKEYKTKLARFVNDKEKKLQYLLATEMKNQVVDTRQGSKARNNKSDIYVYKEIKKLQKGMSKIDVFDGHLRHKYVVGILKKWYKLLSLSALLPIEQDELKRKIETINTFVR